MPEGSDHVELVVAAVAANEIEAAMILSVLEEAGIKAMTKPGTGTSGFGWSADMPRRVYVRAEDLDSAREALAQ